MKVVKKINNNVALCTDNNGTEIIAFGKGIGFPKMPYQLNDITQIERTFYGVDRSYYRLLSEISTDILDISAKIVDYATNRIEGELNPNITFTLADHINFAIQRHKSNMHVDMPFGYDIRHLYETEMEIGEAALKFINKRLKLHLPKQEATGIALHFINAKNAGKGSAGEKSEKIIEDIIQIIETYFEMSIDREGFNYSRFVSHMQYLLKRKNNSINSGNKDLFWEMKKDFESTYQCVLEIEMYLTRHLDWTSSEEELLYLMLHVNRLCSREDCYQ